MDNKELALAVNFAKAPKEIQDAAKAANAINVKIEKAKAAIMTKSDELIKLEREQGIADKALRKLMAEWVPAVEVTT